MDLVRMASAIVDMPDALTPELQFGIAEWALSTRNHPVLARLASRDELTDDVAGFIGGASSAPNVVDQLLTRRSKSPEEDVEAVPSEHRLRVLTAVAALAGLPAEVYRVLAGSEDPTTAACALAMAADDPVVAALAIGDGRSEMERPVDGRSAAGHRFPPPVRSAVLEHLPDDTAPAS